MQTESEKPMDTAGKSSLAGYLHGTKLPAWVSLVLLLILFGVIGWSVFATNANERRFAEERQRLDQKLAADVGDARRQMQEALSDQTREMRGLFGTALAWAVRSSMLRENLDEIDQYFMELVKNPHIALVLLADSEGKVLRSTDRKYLETQFATHFPPALLQDAGVSIHAGAGNAVRLVLPIQGLTSRLGTVLLEYTGTPRTGEPLP